MKTLSFFKKSVQTTSEKGASLGLLLLRIGILFPMIYLHGYPRLNNFNSITGFADPLGIGSDLSLTLVVFAEFFCALFLIIGFLTRWSCIPLIITMMVATWIVNGGKDFLFQEKSFVYLITFVSLLISGAGRFSLDFILFNKKAKL